MMRNYYQLTLYLIAAIALAGLVWFLHVSAFGSEAAKGAVVFVALPLAILFGLWLGSNFARYIGALWFLVSVGAVIWPIATTGKITFSFGAAWVVLLGALSLSACWLL